MKPAMWRLHFWPQPAYVTRSGFSWIFQGQARQSCQFWSAATDVLVDFHPSHANASMILGSIHCSKWTKWNIIHWIIMIIHQTNMHWRIHHPFISILWICEGKTRNIIHQTSIPAHQSLHEGSLEDPGPSCWSTESRRQSRDRVSHMFPYLERHSNHRRFENSDPLNREGTSQMSSSDACAWHCPSFHPIRPLPPLPSSGMFSALQYAEPAHGA